MDGYQLPASFENTTPLKPTTSTPTIAPNNSFRGFDSFAFLDAPPKDVLSPPVSAPKAASDGLPAYGQSSFTAEQPRSYPSSGGEIAPKTEPKVSSSVQPPLYQLPFRPVDSPHYQLEAGSPFLQPQQAQQQPQVATHQQPAFQQVNQQQQQQPVRSLPQQYNYPGPSDVASRDPVKALIEAYPNPHTEYEKLRQLLENMNAQMQSHFKKMELFTESVDQRLSNLESAIRDNSKSKAATSLYPKDSNRDKSPAYKYKTSPKAKKKKKTRLISAYETDPKSIPAPSIAESESTEADEELARKLQRQFNAEAESPISTDNTVSDEEYARKLQSLYLKRDMQRVAKKKAATPSEAKEALDPKKKPEEKPSLWSRLFGGTAEEGQTEEGDEDTTELKPISAKSPSSTVKPVTYPASTATPTMQPLPVATPYGFYPQQPFMLGAQGIPQYTSYMPMQTPTGQFMLSQPPQSAHLN